MEQVPEFIKEIAAEYERQLVVPKEKPLKQFILCPVGLIGSGKTTVVKQLAERLSLVRISGDEVRKILRERGHGFEALNEILLPIIIKYLDQGYSLCLDRDCASDHTQQILAKAEERYYLKLIWIHINPPEEFILEVLRTRDTTWLGTPDEMLKNYYELKPVHENLNLPFVYTFDPSRDGLSAQIDEACSTIKEKAGNL